MNEQIIMAAEPQESNEQVSLPQPSNGATVPGFATKDAWELAQRQAKALMASDIVPKQYSGNIGNCILALDMAYRMGASPLMVMQNLYIVHGMPSWSSKFMVATFNQCGRFTSIRYAYNADKTECFAWSTEKATGERVEGPTVSMAMAQAEGWSTKSGSKWKTMPELMLMYRAATFLIRAYAPELSMGLHTADEVEDIGYAKVVDAPARPIRLPAAKMDAIIEELQANAGTTVETILEKYPTLVADQVELLKKADA